MSQSDRMARTRIYDFPDNMTFDKDRPSAPYAVRNPVTGKKQRFADESTARKVAVRLNEWLHNERQLQALEAGRPNITGLVEKWKADRLPLLPWSEGHRTNMLAKMNRISIDIGLRTIVHTDCMYIEDYIVSKGGAADTFNDWRYAFVLLWSFAVSRKLADTNEAEKIEERSVSKKLEANQKKRHPLELEGFSAIYKCSEPFLQLAMDTSFVTLQARQEICDINVDEDFRDGYLFIIRQKTSGDSDMAFIKIAITPQIDEFRRRSRKLIVVNNVTILSPYLIHRAPDRRWRQWTENKPHWTYVNADYLTKAFAVARETSGYYSHLRPEQQPTFHEIRGLGSRIYRERGMSEKAIQALMTHSNRKTTEVYLEGGAEALTDADYVPVAAPLNISDVFRSRN